PRAQPEVPGVLSLSPDPVPVPRAQPEVPGVLSPEQQQRWARYLARHVVTATRTLTRLFLVHSVPESLKFAFLFYLLTYVGAVCNGLTLLGAGVICAFTFPVLYRRHQGPGQAPKCQSEAAVTPLSLPVPLPEVTARGGAWPGGSPHPSPHMGGTCRPPLRVLPPPARGGSHFNKNSCDSRVWWRGDPGGEAGGNMRGTGCHGVLWGSSDVCLTPPPPAAGVGCAGATSCSLPPPCVPPTVPACPPTSSRVPRVPQCSSMSLCPCDSPSP
uniref:Reticulon n=1 Tax=Corvus moneduloides TaxID=1196302 RepID=A0A8U7N306_CORMO